MVRGHRVCSGALQVQVMETPIDAPDMCGRRASQETQALAEGQWIS